MKRRIVFLTGGPICPSDRFRIYAYLPALREAGIPFVVRPTWTPRYPSLWIGYPWSELFWIKAACGAVQALGRMTDLMAIGRDDVAVIQREALSWGPPWVERILARRGITAVIDIDDAVHLPASFESDETAERKIERWRNIQASADFMIYGNEFLQKTANPASVPSTVIPSAVDTTVYTPRHSPSPAPTSSPFAGEGGGEETGFPPPPLRGEGGGEGSDLIRIGWVGTRNNLVFLEPLVPVLRQILGEFPNASVEILCNQPSAVHLDLPRLRLMKWTPDGEPAVIAGWDIGLMPLKEDDWSRSKCGMKLLQYLSCGVSAVASPVGANREILAGGGGLAAGSPDEWLAALRSLCADASQRTRLGAAGRANVERNWSVSRWAGRFTGLCRQWMEM